MLSSSTPSERELAQAIWLLLLEFVPPPTQRKKRLDWLLEGGKGRRALVFSDTHTHHGPSVWRHYNSLAELVCIEILINDLPLSELLGRHRHLPYCPSCVILEIKT